MLYSTINNDMKEAMKSHDKETLSTIRLLKSAIDLQKINNKLSEITDDLVIEVASRQVKQHKESITEFRNAGRNDLADNLEREIKLISKYLPEQLSKEEIEKELDKIFEEVKPESKKDMGKIMKEANIRLKGKADFKLVSEIVNSKLGA
ncbi:MAG: GatB/YqeY domain-containing protein [Tenericutes bacterium]|nr:GatB/YqeY domain-containing protein [Mycoplasmatota bacterium]